MAKKIKRGSNMTELKKIIPIFIIGTLVISGLSSAAFSNDENLLLESVTTKISEPVITEKNGFITISLKEGTFLGGSGKPLTPVVVKNFVFPLGTEIHDITIDVQWEKIQLTEKITPAPQSMPLSIEPLTDIKQEPVLDESIYSSSQLYPSEPYTIWRGVGLKDGEHVLFVNIRFNSQYSPADNYIKIPSQIKIDVTYEKPKKPALSADEFDLLIVTDEKFKDQLQPLVNHKNQIGIRTRLETVNEICQKYDGRDTAESIKLRIYDALLNSGIKYVLLAGGHMGQTDEWYVPTRHSNNDDGSGYETGYSSDLYFADVLHPTHYEPYLFDDWDTNDDGVYAEMINGKAIDTPDYYPDVYVGRIPFRYSWEVPIVVNKIINYENHASPSWFKKAVVVAGDTSPPARGSVKLGVYEGELTTSIAAQYLEDIGFNVEKLYTSTGTFKDVDDVVNAISKGCGLVDFEGHGNPAVWGNFWPDAEKEKEFSYGFTIIDIRKFSNGNKLPVMVIGGCHNGQFNVTMQQIINNGGVSYPGFTRLEWVPTDTASWFLLQEGGGSIGSIGNTGLGYGYINEACTMGLGGWIDTRFFHAYAKQNKEYLGEAWAQAITDYLNGLPPIYDGVHQDSVDRKTIEEWVLLGDPSLKIGGTGAFSSEEEQTQDETEKEPVKQPTTSEDVPNWEIGETWTYKIDNIDFKFSEVEGRDVDISLRTGDLQLEVTDITQDSYITEFSTKGLDADINLFLDPYVEGEKPIALNLTLRDIDLSGEIVFDKSTLAIKSVDANLVMDLMKNLDNLPIQLPGIVDKLKPFIKYLISEYNR